MPDQQVGKGRDGGERPATQFQVTIWLPAGGEAILEELDIDVLPVPPRPGDEPAGVVAVVRLDEVERLVAGGARVTVERMISHTFPPELIMSDEEARARLEALARLQEGDEG